MSSNSFEKFILGLTDLRGKVGENKVGLSFTGLPNLPLPEGITAVPGALQRKGKKTSDKVSAVYSMASDIVAFLAERVEDEKARFDLGSFIGNNMLLMMRRRITEGDHPSTWYEDDDINHEPFLQHTRMLPAGMTFDMVRQAFHLHVMKRMGATPRIRASDAPERDCDKLYSDVNEGCHNVRAFYEHTLNIHFKGFSDVLHSPFIVEMEDGSERYIHAAIFMADDPDGSKNKAMFITAAWAHPHPQGHKTIIH